MAHKMDSVAIAGQFIGTSTRHGSNGTAYSVEYHLPGHVASDLLDRYAEDVSVEWQAEGRDKVLVSTAAELGSLKDRKDPDGGPRWIAVRFTLTVDDIPTSVGALQAQLYDAGKGDSHAVKGTLTITANQMSAGL